MESAEYSVNRREAELEEENRLLREEIRVARQAAEITAQLVVEQFEKADTIMTRLQATSARLSASNEELGEANERLQKLDQMKSDFLSSVSHELRTPLTSIRGFASLIDREFSRSFAELAGEDGTLRKKAQRIRDNLEIILKESERLTRLINDVLDLAKIEAGRIVWNDALTQPETLIRDAMNAVQGMFDLKPQVLLRAETEHGLPPFFGDADRLMQVLVNLLNNAAKFTDAGEVVISATRNDDDMIRIDVRDTGIGFPAEDAELIFDKFQQSKQGDTLTERPKGTGLGLAISREIVTRHGGSLLAASEIGKGSVFTLTLPAAKAAAAEATSAAPANTCDGKTRQGAAQIPAKPGVLVVDDDPGVRGYLSQLLEEQGYRVIAAEDGVSALSAAREFHPALITMDLAMPVMDGRTAITRLRADPDLQHIPIMVVSAIPGWDSAGGDLAMCKPIDEPRFLGNIRLLLGAETQPPGATLNFLVLHDDGESPPPGYGNFTAHCEVIHCPLHELPAKIQAGFHGMVVIPTHLLAKVDLALLNGTPSLEVMIMPEQSAGRPALPPLQPLS